MDDKFLAVLGEIWKAQKIWERIARILGWEGSSPQVSGMFSKAVVQVVLHLGQRRGG